MPVKLLLPQGLVVPAPLSVVLVPGLLCDARLWAPVRARLAAPAVDVQLAEAESLPAMADAVAAAAPVGAVLAGFSMGGMAALLAAARAPGRYGALVILNTHAEIDTPARAQARLEQMARAEAGGFGELVAGLKPAYFGASQDFADERRLVAQMAHGQGEGRFVRHVRAILERPDLAGAARRAHLPAHVVAGARDELATPEAARRLADLLPDATLTVLEGCGHLSPLERPDAVAALLNRCAAGARELRPA